MTFPFGQTRTHVDFDHALIAPDGHVMSPLSHWTNTSGVVLISPAMGAFPRCPRFTQYIAHTTAQSVSHGPGPGVQRLVYVLEGSILIDQKLELKVDDFAWMPPDHIATIHGRENGRVLVFEKPYTKSHTGVATPGPIVGSFSKIEAQPFMGDSDAMLTTLLPIHDGFDMAVNVFTYQSGATLPFVETHVMEHGLYMRSGQGVYRLADKWYPVAQGDTIWMAAYCPQWFVAMGKSPASYIYYKDIHRDPLQGNLPSCPVNH